MKEATLLWLVVTVLLLGGCTVSTKDTLIATQSGSNVRDKVSDIVNPDEPSIALDTPSSVAILPFNNLTSEQVASDVLRQVVNSHLSGMNFQLMHPAEVDLRLPDGPIEQNNMASFLGVEAVVIGDVVKFERFFAGIYAQIKLGVVLRMYDANGSLIWKTEQEVVQSAGGVSTSAWGLILNAAVAAMHLDDENVLAAADELGRKVAREFPQPRGYVAQPGPILDSVLHDGGGKWLHYGDMVKIGLKGASGMYASADVGNLTRVELEEIEPGTYIGQVLVEGSWNEERVSVKGRLQDGLGNVSTQISIAGLLDFDNVPPEKVTSLTGSLTPNTLKLTWDHEDNVQGYEVWLGKGAQKNLIDTVQSTFVNTSRQFELFQQYDFEVFALDRAGNKSEQTRVSLTAYPQEVGKQTFLTGAISGRYQGIVMLTTDFSPFQVKGNVLFEAGSELYIEPGVELIFDPGAVINIQGQAYFWGMKEKITLKPIGEIQRKKPYLILDSENATQIAGVDFLDGGQGVEIKRGQAIFDVVEFLSSRFTALTVSGEADVVLKHCVIDGSNTSAIVVSDFAKLTVSSCTFKNNFPFHIQNASQYPVNAVDNNWVPAASTTTVLGEVRY